jgi:hypothetical protein
LLSPATKVRRGAAASAPARVEALTYTLGDVVEAARVVVPDLRASCDVLVALAHMSEEEARQLVSAVPGIDLVVLGHDPQNRSLGEPLVVGGARILRATSQGQYVGDLGLVLDDGHRVSQVHNRLHSLGEQYADDRDMARLVDEFDRENRLIQKELFAREQLKSASNDPLGTRYLGVGACQSCHVDEFDVYAATGHARAYETLSTQFVHRDTNCVGCHVTGWGEEGGFQGVRLRGAMVDLIDVQCEACHGPGAEHTRDGSYRERARASCVRCHTPADDPDFDYERDWAAIAH